MPRVINRSVRFNTAKSTSDPKFLIVFMIFQLGNKRRLKYAANLKLEAKYWDKNKQRPNTSYPDYPIELKRLNQIEEKTLEIWKENKNISAAEFRKELDYRLERKVRPSTKVPTLFESIDLFVEREKNKEGAKRGTWKKYETVFNHLKEYAKEKKIQLDYNSIDWDFRHEFLNWLYLEKNHATNNASKIFAVLKRFMEESFKHGYHNNLKYKQNGFGVKRVKTKNKVRLTFKELHLLMKLKIEDDKHLEKARDLFIVGCFTGLRFSDWNKLGNTSKTTDEEGNVFFQIITQKTDTEVLIYPTSEVLEILEKYNYSLPTMHIQNFNKHIKTVCKMASIDKEFLRVYSEGGKMKDTMVKKHEQVSSHAARRSFATNFWEAGVPANEIMQITGHATQKQFFEYIDVSKNDLAKSFAKNAKLMRRGNLKKIK